MSRRSKSLIRRGPDSFSIKTQQQDFFFSFFFLKTHFYLHKTTPTLTPALACLHSKFLILPMYFTCPESMFCQFNAMLNKRVMNCFLNKNFFGHLHLKPHTKISMRVSQREKIIFAKCCHNCFLSFCNFICCRSKEICSFIFCCM